MIKLPDSNTTYDPLTVNFSLATIWKLHHA